MIKPGKYKAKATSGAWANVGEKGTPGVGVKFEFDCDGVKSHLWHVLYLTNTLLKDGSTVAEKTFEMLAKLGYDESIPLAQDAQGNPIFDGRHLADKEMEIVVENEEYEGKTRAKIKWVNELGGGQLAGLPVEKVLGNVNLKSAMAAARARMGIQAPVAKVSQGPVNSDIPF